MSLTVGPVRASEAPEATARIASLVVSGETRLITFGTGLHGGAIDHELMYYDVRVTRAGRSAGHTATPTTSVGRGRRTTCSYGAAHRPRVAARRDVATIRIDEMISRSDIVTLSYADLAWLRPGDHRGDAIRWLMSRGLAFLVVTHGDTAATGYTRSGSVHIRGRQTMVADRAEWEEAFVDGLLAVLATRGLLDRRTDRSLRSMGPEELKGILHDANLHAAQVITLPVTHLRSAAADSHESSR